jgi:hypothetical protein
MGLGSGIRKKPITDPGSRAQKGTGSRIRNTAKLAKKKSLRENLKAGTGHDGIDGESPAPPVHRAVGAELPAELLPSHPQLWRPVRPFAPRADRHYAPRRVHQAERIVAALRRTRAVKFDAQRLGARDADVAGEGDVVGVRVDALL